MPREAKGNRRKKATSKDVAPQANNQSVSASDMELIISRLSEISNRRKVDALDALIKAAPPIGAEGSRRAAEKARLIADDLDESSDLLALLPTG
ncbi:MAG: hypothetical protein AAGF58_04465 [Pseudomonadota bacterium]